jgi:hypothetical protein
MADPHAAIACAGDACAERACAERARHGPFTLPATAPAGAKRKREASDAERKYACDFDGCEYRSVRSGTLKRHKLTHSDKRPLNASDAEKKTPPDDALPLVSAPGYYVTPDGCVYNSSGMSLAKYKIGSPYLKVTLRIGGKHVPKTVHRLVALAFIGPQPSSAHTVDHINRNPIDNRVSNLRWATPAEQSQNIEYSREHSNSRRAVVFKTSSETRFFSSVSEASSFLFGKVCAPSRLHQIIGTGKLYRGGTWNYDNVSFGETDYRPISPQWMHGLSGYFAGSDGTIKTPLGRVTLGSIDKHSGYSTITVSNKHEYRVHVLIARTFIENTEEKPVVNHKNGCKTDNRTENLEWATYSENALHAHATGLCKIPQGKRVFACKGTEVKCFESVSEAARAVGGSAQNIFACLRGAQRTAYGCTWSLAPPK